MAMAEYRQEKERLSRFGVTGAVFVVILLMGCSGGNMLQAGQKAPSLSARSDGSIQTIDGRTLTLDTLGREGPVVLVLLRGFS